MNDWAKLKEDNKRQMMTVMKDLSSDEQVVLNQVLKFELENRHVNTPRFVTPIKTFIERAIR